MSQKGLIVTTAFPPVIGGVCEYALSASQLLYEMGVLQGVLTSTPAEDEGMKELPVTRLPSFFNRKILKIIPIVVVGWKRIKSENINWIVSLTWTHEGIASYLINKVTGCPYVIVVHGSEILLFEKSRVASWFMRIVFSRAQAVVTNSSYTKTLIEHSITKKIKIFIVPPVYIKRNNGGSQGSRKKIIDKSQHVLLTVSRLAPRKGHMLVLEALSSLVKTYPDIQYVITGRGNSEADIKSKIKELGLEDIVCMAGFVDSHTLEELYKKASIYVSPGIEIDGDVEGFGISFIEAAQYGVPAIAGNYGGVSDAVIDGETGILLTPVTVNTVKKAILRLLDDDTLRQKMGENAQSYVQRKFSETQQVARWNGVLQYVQS